jgi:hypothetical protein
MASKYIHRYANEHVLAWMVALPKLNHAPDLPQGSRALQIVHDYVLEGKTASAPVTLGLYATRASILNARFCSSLALCLRLRVEVMAGGLSDQVEFRQGLPPLITLTDGDPTKPLHELAHVMFGPSEAIAQAWALRQLL